MADKGKKGLWVYRAYDEDGFVVMEAYDKAKLIERIDDGYYWGDQKLTIKREFVEGLE